MALSNVINSVRQLGTELRSAGRAAQEARGEIDRTVDRARAAGAEIQRTFESTRGVNRELAPLFDQVEQRAEAAGETVRRVMAESTGWVDGAAEGLAATEAKAAELSAIMKRLTVEYDAFQLVSRPDLFEERKRDMRAFIDLVQTGGASIKDLITVLDAQGGPVFKRAAEVLKGLADGRATAAQLIEAIKQINNNLGEGNALGDLLEAVLAKVPS